MSKSSFYASTGPGTSDLELLDWYLAQITAIYDQILTAKIEITVSLAAAEAAQDQGAGCAVDSSTSADEAAVSAAAAEYYYTQILQVVAQPIPESIIISCSDELSPLIVGVAQVTFRMPYGMVVQNIKASLTTAQSAGSLFTVDVNSNGVSLLTTRVTIDNTETTSVSAVTPHVLNTGVTTLFSDSVITVDIDQLGNGTATGLKVYMSGVRT